MDKSPAEQKLSSDEAIEILEEGKSQMLPGAGWKIGSFKSVPYYNPHLMVRRLNVQRHFFEQLFDAASCHILNTGIEPVEKTQDRIRKILMEA